MSLVDNYAPRVINTRFFTLLLTCVRADRKLHELKNMLKEALSADAAETICCSDSGSYFDCSIL